MSARLAVVESPLDAETFGRVDSETDAVLCTAPSIASAEASLLERFATRRTMLVVVGGPRWAGRTLALALLADVFAPAEDSVISPAEASRELLEAIVRRIGRKAIPLLVKDPGELSAAEAVECGLADLTISPGANPLEWFSEWMGSRSLLALSVTAALIRGRAGDPGETAEFARLFAAGEPQKGLAAFLEKREPLFSNDWSVERI